MTKKKECYKDLLKRFSVSEKWRADIELDKLNKRTDEEIKLKAFSNAILDKFMTFIFTTFYAIVLTWRDGWLSIDDCFDLMRQRAKNLMNNCDKETTHQEAKCVFMLCDMLEQVHKTLLLKEVDWEIEKTPCEKGKWWIHIV